MSNSVIISGVNIPSRKGICIGLTGIYGIGINRAKKICDLVGVKHGDRFYTLDVDVLNKIRECVLNDYVVEGDLRSQVRDDILQLINISCYRGRRHRSSLPTRGQRTKTNAHTSKKRRRNI